MRLGLLMAAAGLALMLGAVVMYRSAQRDSVEPAAAVAGEAAPAPSPTPEPTPPTALNAVPAEPVPPVRTSPRRSEGAARTTAPAAPVAPSPPVATSGTLTITADVAGAQVFLDRQFIGAAPVTAPDVTPGTHQLNVSAPGYDPIVQTIEVAPGPRDIAIRFREIRLNLTLDVIHKHRLGSCRGRLVATPQGLRYETTDKDDAFSAGLLDLEAFQVDYLAKTLRIQARRGRRFDFTDPEGNADRLFVFHRDVDKAREQMRKAATP